MTRLIDADALNEKLCNTTIFIKSGEIFQRMINDAPTIEPNGDTISRSQAIKDVSEWATDILHPDRLVKEDAIHILESLPSAEQITGKLNNPDDSLLTADSEACKEQKSKLDLISRQDALAEFQDGRDVYDIMESIEELPSADAVEAVRCKDCKWSDWYKTLNGEHRCYCMEHGSSGHTDDDYCSYGERREP